MSSEGTDALIAQGEKVLETGDPEAARRFLADLEQQRAKLASLERAVRMRIIEANIIFLERAKDIMGPNNFAGPDFQVKTFGLNLSSDDIHPIIALGGEGELEQARDMNQVLRYRVGHIGRTPLTMKLINERLTPRFQAEGKGNIFFDTNWYGTTQPFFLEDTPREGWHLQTRELIPNSAGNNALSEMDIFAAYVKTSFKGTIMPQDWEQALQEFEKQRPAIQKFVDKSEWQNALGAISNLTLNKLGRRIPVEIAQDIPTHFDNTDERLLEKMYERTTRFSSGGGQVGLVGLGDFDSGGLHAGIWPSDAAGPRVGASFSRSLPKI